MKRLFKWIVRCIVALFVIGYGLSYYEEYLGNSSRQRGFLDRGDEIAATEAHITDPAQWREIKAQRNAACKLDITCYGKQYFISADVYCKDDIQNLAKYNFRWTDKWNERKFSRMSWSDKNKNFIHYVGDKIEMQNGLGVFLPFTYYCDFDPVLKRVIRVGATSGRLSTE